MKKVLTEVLKLIHYPDALYPTSSVMNPTNPAHKGKKGIIAVGSDNSDDNEASNEIFAGKKKGLFKKWSKGGIFDWDGDASIWYTSVDEFNKAKVLIKRANRDLVDDDGTISTADGSKVSPSDMMKSLEELDKVLGLIENSDFLRAKIDSFMDSLANIETDDEMNNAINDYMEFIASLVNYSDRNSALIKMQNPNATQVASFTGWLENGRVPLGTTRGKIAGQNSMSIIQALWYGARVGKYPTILVKPPVHGKFPQGWRRIFVYDIADTRDAELADYKTKEQKKILLNNDGQIPTMGDSSAIEEPNQMDWWDQQTGEDVKADKLFELLRKAADSMGVDTAGMNLTSTEGHINVQTKKVSNKVASVTHNLVHSLVHDDDGEFNYLADSKLSHAHQELQAEMVTFLVMKSFRLQVQHHPSAIRAYRKNPELIKDDIKLASQVGSHIVKKLKAIQKSERLNRSLDEEFNKVLSEMAESY